MSLIKVYSMMHPLLQAIIVKLLAGGKYLDLLGLTVVIQFGTALWSYKFYWLLCIIPPVGLWTLYSTFKGSMPGASDGGSGIKEEASGEQPESEEVTNRRQKRAERRRQKRS